MAHEDERFMRMLLATFQDEAREHLAAMSTLLLGLEKAPREAPMAQAVETLFREAHSLKGAARSVNLVDIERVCQALERVLSAAKRRELALSRPYFDTLHASLDGLATMLARTADGRAAADPGAAATLARSLDALLVVPAATAPVRSAAPAPDNAESAPLPAPAASDTVRIATAKLEALMTQAEELQVLKVSSAHLVAEMRALVGMMSDWKRQIDKSAAIGRALRRLSMRPSRGNGGRDRMLSRLVESAERDEAVIKPLIDRLARAERAADRDSRGLARRTDRLQADMRQALMLPFATLFAAMPKLVRDLAQASGKDVELVTGGTTLEVDRRLLEGLKAPLTHLIRNAVDHGVELPDERRRLGKAPRGRIVIEVATRAGNQVELVVADDGAGIALDRVRERAQRMGIASAADLAAMAPERVADLVFASGLSTSPILTDLSGHGLGLAIVREKIEGLAGSIALERPDGGVGTRFRMLLPSTLATFRGLLVTAGDRRFVLPSRSVERVGRVTLSAIRRSEDGDAIVLAGETLPLASLAGTLELESAASRRELCGPHCQVVVATSGDARVAFAVDEVIEDLEVLVKPLAPPLKRVRHIAGATVMGAGQVVPVLNVADMVKSVLLRGARVRLGTPAAQAPRASLLVAEDSVTSRELLKEVLESAGYQVTTAADGLAALSTLQGGEFDLLVSDVEMPRLDGFDLTARVRHDKRLARLPVVLVTALDSGADRQRGVEVGANAYIAKSGFDQRHLLEAIRTLL